jgi:hypothetical protein
MPSRVGTMWVVGIGGPLDLFNVYARLARGVTQR